VCHANGDACAASEAHCQSLAYFEVVPEVDEPVDPEVPEPLEVPDVPAPGVVGIEVLDSLLGLGAAELGDDELDEPLGLVLEVPLAPEP
jgi:hypothetical protein